MKREEKSLRKNVVNCLTQEGDTIPKTDTLKLAIERI